MLYGAMDKLIKEKNLPLQMNHIGSLGCLFFTGNEVTNYEDAKTSDTAAFGKYFAYMLNHGIHLAPSQFEAMFMSTSHTVEDINKTIEVFTEYFTNEF